MTGAPRSASPSPTLNKQLAPPNAGRPQYDQNTDPDSTGEPQDPSQADPPSQGDPAPSPLPSESDPRESTQAPNNVDPDSTGEPKHPSQAAPQSGGDPPTSPLQTRVIQWGVANHQMQIFRLKAARSLHPRSVKQTLITPIAVQSAGQLKIAGAAYTADSASQYIVAGQTLTPGGAITVSNTPISLAIGGAMAVVGTSTQLLATPPPPTEAPILTFGGTAYIADASSAFSIGSQVLTPGGAVTISNTPISLVPGGTIAVVGTSSQLLAPMTTPTETPVLTFNGMTYAADVSSAFTIDGQTLTPGGAIFVSSSSISLAVSGTFADIGTSTQLLAPTATFTEALILSFEGTAYTADVSSAFTIDGQPLTKGAIITVNGAEGTAAVIGSSTQILGTATITGSDTATITFAVQTYTEDAAGDFIIGGQTLRKGWAITVSGTPVSFAAGGTDVVVGSSTEAVGVGGWVMSGFGPGAAQTGVVAFEGKGARRRPDFAKVMSVVAVVRCCVLM
ncbi:hypothetical protein OEA41_005199 [Lepraria neglecta]|uniref:Uncharacterized protein n=1 Tax=Lepraria neglecta TaxID=209136 RepID=A0AAD9YZE6_9LECA|nr:hypothetical protein OEA41_005199 [Lepraria neglecta]